MAVAALVLGLVGCMFGLIPLFFFIAIPAGILGVVFGVVGIRRANAVQVRKTMATWGMMLGIAATGLGIVGLAVVGKATSDLDRCFDAIDDADFGITDAVDDAC